MSFFDTITYKGNRYQTHSLMCKMQEYVFGASNNIVMTDSGNGSKLQHIQWSQSIVSVHEETGDEYIFRLNDGLLVGFIQSEKIKMPFIERLSRYYK